MIAALMLGSAQAALSQPIPAQSEPAPQGSRNDPDAQGNSSDRAPVEIAPAPTVNIDTNDLEADLEEDIPSPRDLFPSVYQNVDPELRERLRSSPFSVVRNQGTSSVQNF